MFRIKDAHIDTLSERIVFIHRRTVEEGSLGFRPLDRVHVAGIHPETGAEHQITGVLNFCSDALVERDEIGLSAVAFHDLDLPDGCEVNATLAPPPHSVDRVRAKLRGSRLEREDFHAILNDVVRHKYSKIELSMFVLACALRSLDLDETVNLTRAMVETGSTLDFGPGPIVDKHCIGGVPGNRSTMVVVPILASLGLTVPKTSSRAITSPAGTADTMEVLANVSLSRDRLYQIVEKAGACIAWGGALDLAPADDIMITVERPMELDTEVQMVASILAKKRTAGATHALIDVPVGRTAKIRSHDDAVHLARLFEEVASQIGLVVEVVITEAKGPIGRGIGPRLEALDVLSVLRRDADAPVDLREKSLCIAARILELTGKIPAPLGYRSAQQALDSGAAEQAMQRIIEVQGERPFPAEARYRCTIEACEDGPIREIDCWQLARVAKHAGAPANVSAGVWLHKTVGDVVSAGEALFEIHAQSESQLEFARSYAECQAGVVQFGL